MSQSNGKPSRAQALRQVRRAADRLAKVRDAETKAQQQLQAAVRAAVAAGLTVREIGAEAGLTGARIGQIAQGKR